MRSNMGFKASWFTKCLDQFKKVDKKSGFTFEYSSLRLDFRAKSCRVNCDFMLLALTINTARKRFWCWEGSLHSRISREFYNVCDHVSFRAEPQFDFHSISKALSRCSSYQWVILYFSAIIRRACYVDLFSNKKRGKVDSPVIISLISFNRNCKLTWNKEKICN